jgi:hypothetical protein
VLEGRVSPALEHLLAELLLESELVVSSPVRASNDSADLGLADSVFRR